MSKLRIALFVSLFMHLSVIAALLISGSFSSPKVTPEPFNAEPIIEARVIDENQLQNMESASTNHQTLIISWDVAMHDER